MQNSLDDQKSDESKIPKAPLMLRVCCGTLYSLMCLGIALALGHLVFGIPLPWEMASDAERHQHEVAKTLQQYAKATAHAIYHVSFADLTEEQRDAFERRLQEVRGEDDDAQRQYVAIGSDITMAAVYGIIDDDPVETLMGKAREKMLDADLDRRKMIVLELQHLAQVALVARQQATKISVRGEELEQAQNDFERAKKLITAALMKYSELYPAAPTH